MQILDKAASATERVRARDPNDSYHPELDALRFVAFLLVFLYHAIPLVIHPFRKAGFPEFIAAPLWSLLHGGAYGVDVFFVLSSFLITKLLLREQEKYGTINVKAFYARRVLRIWPLYLTFLFLAPLLLGAIGAREDLDVAYLLAFALFVGNWACAFWGFPESAASPLWSVSVEEQFYLAWPIIMHRWIHRLPLIVAGLFVVGFMTRFYLVSTGAPEAATWCNTFAHADSIGGGALLAWFLHGKKRNLSPAVRWALGCAAVSMIAILGRYCDYSGTTILIGYPSAAFAGVILVYCFFNPVANRVSSAPSRVIAHLGRISYGLYVFHAPVIHLTRVHSASTIRWALSITSALALTILLAWLSYTFLEKPFLKLKRRFTLVDSAPVLPSAT